MDFLENLSREELTNIVRIFDIQIAIVIMLVVFVTKSIFAKVVINIVYKIQKRKGNPKDSSMYNTLRWMYVFIGLYLASNILPIGGKPAVIIETFFRIVLVIFVTQTINNTIFVKDSILFKRKKDKPINETIAVYAFRICRVIAWLIAAYVIFLVLGLDLSGLIAGLGIGTVLISLAAQDTVKSLLSGFSILSDKPFVIGDFVQVGLYSGTVINITFRSTRIRCLDNSIVTIPNSTITTDYVINWSKLKTRRIEYNLTIDMDASIEQIKKIVKEIKTVLCAKDYVKEDTVYVGFNTISSYSNDITIFFYVTETDYNKYLDLKQEINLEILKILEKENVSLAFPTETIHVKNIDDKKVDISKKDEA